MALPTNADVIVVHGYWLDELTGVGVKQANGLPATIMFDPVPLLGANAAKTPNLRDLTSNAHLKTRTRVASVDPVTGYYAAQLVASNDPDLDAYSGRRVTFLGEDPFTIEVPYNAPTVTVSAEMAAKTGLTQGSSVKAIWLPNASVTTIPTPTPSVNYLSSSQTLANIAAGIETHDDDPDAHADIRALIGTPYTDEQARDTLAAALVAGSNVTITPNDGADTITISVSAPSSYSDEQAQDAFAALIAAGTHSGISFAYNDAGNALSATVAAQSWSQITGTPSAARFITPPVTSTASSGTITPDASASSVFRYTATGNVTLNDPINGIDGQGVVVEVIASGATRTLSFAGGASSVSISSGQRWAGVLRYDAGASLWALVDGAANETLVAGANITLTPDTTANTLTISATGASYTDEQAQDAIAALIAAGSHSGITFAYNDASNTLSATVAAPSASSITTGTLPDSVIPAGIARDSEVATAVANLVNSAPTTLDTLGEIATALQTDESAAAALTTTVAGKATALTPTATVKTSAYTAAAGEFVPADVSGGSWTLTFPTAPADKTRVAAKVVVAPGANTLTLACGGSDHFNTTTGPATASLTLLNQAIIAQYQASTAVWYVQSTDVPLSQLDTRYDAAGAASTAQAAAQSYSDARTINGYTGHSVTLAASDVSAVPVTAARVITRKTGAYIFGSTSVGTSSVLANGTLRVCPLVISDASLSIAAAGAELTAAGDASAIFRFGIWNDDGNGWPGTLLQEFGSISAGTGNAGTVTTGGTAGAYAVTLGSTLVLTQGVYWIGGAVQGVTTTQPGFRTSTFGVPLVVAQTAIPASGPAGAGYSVTGVTGAFGSFPSFGSQATTSTIPRVFLKLA